MSANDDDSLVEDRRGEQLGEMPREQRAAQAVQEQTETDVSPSDVEATDEGMQLSEQAQREEAASQLQSALPIDVLASDVVLGEDGPQLMQAARDRLQTYRREQAAGELESDLESQLGEDLQRGEDFTVVSGDDGWAAELTESFKQERRDKAVADLESQLESEVGEGLKRGEDFTIAETDEGLSAELTQSFKDEQRQEAREKTIADLESQLESEVGEDLKRGEDFQLTETDEGLSAELTDSFRREQAAESFDAQYGVNIGSGDVVSSGEGWQLESGVRNQIKKQQAVEDLQGQTKVDLGTGDVQMTDDGVGLTRSARRLEKRKRALEQFESQTVHDDLIDLQDVELGKGRYADPHLSLHTRVQLKRRASNIQEDRIESNLESELGVDDLVQGEDYTITNRYSGLDVSLSDDLQKQQAIGDIQSETDIDVSESDLTVEGETVTLDEEARKEVAKERLAEQYSEQISENTNIGFHVSSGSIENVEFTEDGVRGELAEDTKQTVADASAAARIETISGETVQPWEVETEATDEGREVTSVDESAMGAYTAFAASQLDRQRMGTDIEAGDISVTEPGEVEYTDEFRREQAAADIESELQKQGFAVDVGAGDVSASGEDYTLDEELSGQIGEERAFREAAGVVGGTTKRQRRLADWRDVARGKLMEAEQLENQPYREAVRGRREMAARRNAVEALEKQIYGPFAAFSGTDLDASDVTFETTATGGVRASPSEDLRQELEGSIEKSLVRELEDETGVDLSREDVTVEETGEGYRASLSEAGEKTVEIETTPGEDLPIVGGVMTTGTRARMRIRGVTDPAAEAWREHTPSKEDVLGFASAAAPVAAAEPSLVGEAGLAAIVGTGLGAAALQKRGNVLTGDDPRAQAARAAPTMATAEVGIGDPVTSNELGVGGSTQDVSELTPNSRVRVSELSAGGDGFVEETRVRVPSGGVFSDELAVPDADAGESTTPIAGTEPVTQGALERAKSEEEDVDVETPVITEEDILDDDFDPREGRDPFSVRDRRIEGPYPLIENPEDVTEPVDPTSGTFESGEDIGEGIAGQGQSVQPARDVDTVQENWEQFLEEEQERLEEAQESSLARESVALNREGLAGLVTAGELTQSARQRLMQAEEASQQSGTRQTLREVAQQQLGPRSGITAGPGQDIRQGADELAETDAREDLREAAQERLGLRGDVLSSPAQDMRQRLNEQADGREQARTRAAEAAAERAAEMQQGELLQSQSPGNAQPQAFDSSGYGSQYGYPVEGQGYPYLSPPGTGLGYPGEPSTPTRRFPRPDDDDEQTGRRLKDSTQDDSVAFGVDGLGPGWFNEYISAQAGLGRGSPGEESLEAAAGGRPETALPTEGELEAEEQFDEALSFFTGEGTGVDASLDFGDDGEGLL